MAHLSGFSFSSVRIFLGCTCLLGAAITPQIAAAQTTSVPIRHAENNSVRAVHFVAAQVSKDALVLVVFGDDTATKNLAMRAASAAIIAKYPLRGVILGPRRDDARSALEFYADAQLTATYINPAEKDIDAALRELKRGYAEIILPRRTAGK
jgi:hypothetical protein